MSVTEDPQLEDIKARAHERNNSGLIGGVREWGDINYLLRLLNESQDDRSRRRRTATVIAAIKFPDDHRSELPGELLEAIDEYAGDILAFIDGKTDAIHAHEIRCVACESLLRERYGKYGPFLHCPESTREEPHPTLSITGHGYRMILDQD